MIPREAERTGPALHGAAWTLSSPSRATQRRRASTLEKPCRRTETGAAEKPIRARHQQSHTRSRAATPAPALHPITYTTPSQILLPRSSRTPGHAAGQPSPRLQARRAVGWRAVGRRASGPLAGVSLAGRGLRPLATPPNPPTAAACRAAAESRGSAGASH